MFLFYWAHWNVLTKLFCIWYHAPLSSYKGIDHMVNVPSFKKLFLSVIYAYGTFAIMPVKNPYGFSAFPSLRVFIVIYYGLSFFAAFRLYNKISGKGNKIMFILLLLLLPFVSNLIFLMVGGDRTAVYAAMLYGMIVVFLFLPLLDFYKADAGNVRKRIISFILGGLVIFWGWFNNGVYRTSHHVIEQNIAVWNRIITEAESLEEYQPQMPVCILGEYPNIPSVAEQYECFNKVAALRYVNGWALPYFLKNYLGWEKSFTSTVPELPEEFPIYPDKGSIVIIDDVVVLHFDED